MWLLFGVCAIVTGLVNLLLALRHAEPKWFRFSSMAFTALTVCAFYHDAAQRVVREDWSGLMDILPAVSRLLWICVAGSILINVLSLVIKNKAE